MRRDFETIDRSNKTEHFTKHINSQQTTTIEHMTKQHRIILTDYIADCRSNQRIGVSPPVARRCNRNFLLLLLIRPDLELLHRHFVTFSGTFLTNRIVSISNKIRERATGGATAIGVIFNFCFIDQELLPLPSRSLFLIGRADIDRKQDREEGERQ